MRGGPLPVRSARLYSTGFLSCLRARVLARSSLPCVGAQGLVLDRRDQHLDTACTERWHRRPCPRRCPKALRKSGRPHVCIPASDPRICPPGCIRHAATCPDRQGGGLVFREIEERRRKTVALPSELVAVLNAHREVQDLERETAANLWRDPTWCSPARTADSYGRGPGTARPTRYPRHPRLHARLVTARTGRRGQTRSGSVRGNCYESGSWRSRRSGWPPIGIEPMTYSLREKNRNRTYRRNRTAG